MPRKILLVDDNTINRLMLKNTLSADYDILEAENGKEALYLMHKHYKMLSAVLLDIVMPEMDGYEVLRHIRDNILLAQIPVIMVTGAEDEDSRVKALSLGANDFILKPFNPDIVKHCLKNNIALRETASILNAIQRDKLTGLYNREAFFEKVAGLIADREPGFYVLSCFDIDNFKLINDQYSAAEGDRILREIGKAVRKNIGELDGVAGRISADNFAALFPAEFKMTDVLRRVLEKNLVMVEQQTISFSVGRYVVTDLTLPASAIYDRAFIAKQSVKGRYDEHLAYFDDHMLEKLVRDQQITVEMENALREQQFEAWFQPQYNHATGELMGAEALTRWRHPQKGIVSPKDFIPLFEQNGFVYELDKFVWRDVCRNLRKWIDERKPVLPVSVNISRYDIFRADLVDELVGIVNEYDIPVELLRLEITESAFTEQAKGIVNIVKHLIRLGFTIEIDDFGSGYSSLNTLKNVPAHVVKLDMRFLDGGDDSRRGGNILESIVRMTKWLGMTVLAEGVEEPEQADFLKSIGCTYVQGYLYAHPMPASEYEELLGGVSIDNHPFMTGTDEILFRDAFWDPKSTDSLFFNKYSGGACVYEFHDGQIEMVRVSDKYLHTVFGPNITAAEAMKIDWSEHIDAETAAAINAAMAESDATKEEVSGEYCFIGLPGCPERTYLRSTLRVIASTDDRRLVYCTSINVTSQREAELRNSEIACQLQAVLDNVSCGITAVTFEGDKLEYLMINDRYFELLGYTREQYALTDSFSLIFEDDRQRVVDAAMRVYKDGCPAVLEYRAVKRDGSIIWLRNSITMTRFDGIDKPVQLSMFSDITAEHYSSPEILEKIPGGVAVYEGAPDKLDEIRLNYFSDGFCRLFGYDREEYERLSRVNPLSLVYSEDVTSIYERITALVRDGAPLDYVYRARVKGGGSKWVNVKGLMGEPNGDRLTVNAVFVDVTELKNALEKLRVSEEVNRIAIEQSGSVVCTYDVGSRSLSVPNMANTIFNVSCTEEDIPYKTVREGNVSPETADIYVEFYEGILKGDREGRAVFQRRSTQGWRWLDARFKTIFSDNGEPVTAVLNFSDVTESIEKDMAYKKWQQSIKDRPPESYSLYHCDLNHNTIIAASEGLLIPEGLDAAIMTIDERTEQYADTCVFEEDRRLFYDALDRSAQLARYAGGKRAQVVEYREKLPDGDYRWIRLTIDLVASPYSSAVDAFLLFENIDEAKRAELEMIERAETDPLTGVLNRSAFAKKVNVLLGRSGKNDKHALMMLDIDGFKLVNDVFGHSAGDKALIDIAEQLKKGLRRGDLVGRLGGDEFVIFLSDIPSDAVVAKRAQHICDFAHKALSVEVQISGSVGIAGYPKDGLTFETLYKKADETLYYVKGTGKNSYAFYHEGMTADEPDELPAAAASTGSRVDYKKRRMLIVDDSKVDFELLANMFKNEFNIEKAMDGASALIKLHHYGSAISVVLLDLIMPGMNGFTVLQKIQQSVDTKSIPVIVVSVAEDPETSLRAIRAGASDYVVKPVDPDILRVRVESAISKSENERLRAQNSFLELQSSEMNSYKTALERTGMFIIVHDWVKSTFAYNPSVSKYLYGNYDTRSLWRILLSDLVTDSQTVQRMQRVVHDVANDRGRMEGRAEVTLKTAAGPKHRFELMVYKQTDDYGLADKLILAFKDLEPGGLHSCQ